MFKFSRINFQLASSYDVGSIAYTKVGRTNLTSPRMNMNRIYKYANTLNRNHHKYR